MKRHVYVTVLLLYALYAVGAAGPLAAQTVRSYPPPGTTSAMMMYDPARNASLMNQGPQAHNEWGDPLHWQRVYIHIPPQFPANTPVTVYIYDAGVGSANQPVTGVQNFPEDAHNDTGTNWGNTNYDTETRYRLYRPGGDTLLGRANFRHDTTTTDLRWVRPQAGNATSFSGSFRFTPSEHGYGAATGTAGAYELLIETISGDDEQEYSVAVDPGNPTPQTQSSAITLFVSDHLTIHFNGSGTFKFAYPDARSIAAGGQLRVSKFDTDIGAQGVSFTSPTSRNVDGVLARASTNTLPWYQEADGRVKTDVITFGQGESNVWTTTYYAATNDTSTWFFRTCTGEPASGSGYNDVNCRPINVLAEPPTASVPTAVTLISFSGSSNGGQPVALLGLALVAGLGLWAAASRVRRARAS